MAVWGLSFDQMLALAGILLLTCVLASKASAKLGIPALILFIGLGMLAGSDGPGGLYFDDYHFAQSLGSVALAFIIFSGGIDTKWSEARSLVWRAISLSLLGVGLTCLMVAAFVVYFLGFEWRQGLLLGAIVSSTDAAAVFSVLRARSINLRRRLIPLLELESGSNDPTAVFLTIGFIQLLTQPETGMWSLIGTFLLQMPIGFAAGWLMGRLARWLMSNLRLEYDGLYPAISISLVMITFGGSHTIGGNGFLAVYVMGLVLAKTNFLHRQSLVQFHDGLAWLMQIAMFITLGLLVYPSKMPPVIGVGLLLAVFLMFIARPIAVYVSLLFAKMRRNERLFIAWGGLRGAVPIILAIFPLIAKVPRSDVMFHLVFFVVLVSVLVQGTTLPLVAKWLGVVDRVKPKPILHRAGSDLIEVSVASSSRAANRMVVNLGLPETAMLVLLRRGEKRYVPQGSTVIQPGDVITIATRKHDAEDLRKVFEA